jgi:uncharacterized membrane protein YfcA
MTILTFTAIVWAGSVLAGLLGALTGLGGGVVIVPMLTLLLGVDIRYAIGASLVSVIATSSGAAVAYLREGFTNMRIGMFLELATTLGATGGALLAAAVAPGAIAVIFGLVLLFSAYFTTHVRTAAQRALPSDRFALRLRMEGSYPTGDGEEHYHVRHVPLGFGLMALAGALSGLLGIGSGAMKVLAMDRAMGLPFKVSTTTSNFMIGVTAAASAGVYLNRGYIDPGLAMPTILGVLLGSLIGARYLPHLRSRVLRLLFAAVVLGLGVEMIYNGWMGRI